MEFLKPYGDLYFGKFRTDYANTRFLNIKNSILQQLLHIDHIDNTLHQHIWFKIYLLHHSITDSWRWPCLLNGLSSADLTWGTGQTRFFATGIRYANPWDYLNTLFFENKQTSVNNFLSQYELIKNDEDLHRVLNLTVDTIDPIPEVKFYISFKNNQFLLEGLHDNQENYYHNVSSEYLEQIVAWKKQYGPKPTLYVFSSRPDLIYDSQQVWGDIVPIKNEQYTSNDIVSEKIYESQLFHAHNMRKFGNTHMLYIADPRPLDVSEFLFWVDLKYSSYIDVNWKYAFIRPDQQYLAKFISLSNILE